LAAYLPGSSHNLGQVFSTTSTSGQDLTTVPGSTTGTPPTRAPGGAIVDDPGAGTWTYALFLYHSGSATATMNSGKLYATVIGEVT
jgi:hypothetical protein